MRALNQGQPGARPVPNAMYAISPVKPLLFGLRPLARPPYRMGSLSTPAFSWTSCHLGAHVGGGWARKSLIDPAVSAVRELALLNSEAYRDKHIID